MTETEIDAIVTSLVPEFEITKVAAITARETFMSLTSGVCADRAAALAALHHWQHLEAACGQILQHIDALAERSVA